MISIRIKKLLRSIFGIVVLTSMLSTSSMEAWSWSTFSFQDLKEFIGETFTSTKATVVATGVAVGGFAAYAARWTWGLWKENKDLKNNVTQSKVSNSKLHQINVKLINKHESYKTQNNKNIAAQKAKNRTLSQAVMVLKGDLKKKNRAFIQLKKENDLLNQEKDALIFEPLIVEADKLTAEERKAQSLARKNERLEYMKEFREEYLQTEQAKKLPLINNTIAVSEGSSSSSQPDIQAPETKISLDDIIQLPLAQDLLQQGFDVAVYQDLHENIKKRIDEWNKKQLSIDERQRKICSHFKNWVKTLTWNYFDDLCIRNHVLDEQISSDNMQRICDELKRFYPGNLDEYLNNDYCREIIEAYETAIDDYKGLGRTRFLNVIFGAHFKDAQDYARKIIDRLECYKLVILSKIYNNQLNKKEKTTMKEKYILITQKIVDFYKAEESKVVRMGHFGGVAKVTWCDPELFVQHNDILEQTRGSFEAIKDSAPADFDNQLTLLTDYLKANTKFNKDIMQKLTLQTQNARNNDDHNIKRLIMQYKHLSNSCRVITDICHEISRKRLLTALDRDAKKFLDGLSLELFCDREEPIKVLKGIARHSEQTMQDMFGQDAMSSDLGLWHTFREHFDRAKPKEISMDEFELV